MAKLIDLTGATVVFNDTINELSSTYVLDFVCNGSNCDCISYNTFSRGPEAVEQPALYFGGIGWVYQIESDGWFKTAYKTIQITGGEDATNADLIAYLQANGTITGGVYEEEHTVQIINPQMYILPPTKVVGKDLIVSAEEVIVNDVEEVLSCLTFKTDDGSEFTLGIVDNTKYWDGTLEYSTDANTWNTWAGTSAISSAGGKLYMRGTGNTYITGASASSAKGRWVLTGSNISCSGNIENLLDWQTVANGEHPIMGEYCYDCMFYRCTSLTKAPELPATTLADYCYSSMFSGCTSLTKTPELPATTLADYCYDYMFYGCTSLTTPPELPATTLADYCYDSMFQCCTSLTTPPKLPATTLTSSCYSSMFRECTSLTIPPELPATTLTSRCYSSMFRECTSLTIPPELPATTLADYCYYYMFYECTNLTKAPELPATTLTSRCYDSMFQYCTSLTIPPELPATTLTSRCYSSMFFGCTNIKLSTTQTGNYQQPYRIPTSGTGTTATYALDYMFYNTGGTFTGTPSINTTYYIYET